ncbi:MAG: NAD(P)/FAD-dependent oxidoreductase [Chitinophagaceae bacterium]
MKQYDVVIIGSGMGGLVCGNILSLEGYSVCVLEKNKQIGGCLQTFVRDKVIFDSGVHYIGGLGEGQTLYQVFKYLGLMNQLKLRQMKEAAFDKIIIGNDPQEYTYAQGYDKFIEALVADFPEEKEAIKIYCDKIREVCGKFPMYNLQYNIDAEAKASVQEIDAQAYIESLTSNKKLQAVLAGNNILYAGKSHQTPFYIHALILNSYIESSWKCIDGGSQIAKYLAKNIREQGGEILRHSEVKKIIIEDGLATGVALANGNKIGGKHFISNLHPVQTLELTDTDLIRKAYRNRMKQLENTISSFTLNIVLKKESFRYLSHNYYYHKEGQLWTMADYTEENWPLGYALFLSASSRSPEYAESMTIFTYMRYDEVKPWQHTFNTVSAEEERGETYEAFKKRKAETLLDCVEERFPGLREHIQTYYTSTPLSYRDYIGTDDGTMYGIAKDYKDPVKTYIAPRTKVPNLYLTGQNLNLHGILGTTISALITSVTLTGDERIIEKVRNA